VAFGAAIEGRSVPGGIFIWKADQLRMVLGAGDESPIGGIFAKFSERIGFGDQGTIVFHGQLKGAPAAAGIFAIRDGRVRRSRAWATRPRAAASTRTSDCGRDQREGNHRLHRGGGRRAEPGHRGAHGRRAGRVAWSASATASWAARASRRSACCRS
jgi:hypothetical protein